jgi:hypothetical protein
MAIINMRQYAAAFPSPLNVPTVAFKTLLSSPVCPAFQPDILIRRLSLGLDELTWFCLFPCVEHPAIDIPNLAHNMKFSHTWHAVASAAGAGTTPLPFFAVAHTGTPLQRRPFWAEGWFR